MSEHDIKYVSEEEAARLWQRAAQLQAEAARRAEERDHGEERALARHTDHEPDGYAVAHVRAAAMEAGIGEEFLDAALKDLEAERALPERKAASTLTKKLLGDPVEEIVRTRMIRATPPEVLEAMEEILPREAFRLNLVDRVGDPLDGGILAFDIVGLSAAATESFTRDAAYAELKQVFFSMRRIDQETTQLTARGPVFWTRGVNLFAAAFMAGGGGAVGMLLGGVLGTSLAVAVGGPVGAALAALAAAGGAGTGGGGGYWGYRALMDYSYRKGVDALDGVLGAVAVRAQRGFGITWRPPEDGLPPGEAAKALPAETAAEPAPTSNGDTQAEAAAPAEAAEGPKSEKEDGPWYPA